MWRLAIRNLLRRPLRHSLVVGGLACSLALLVCLSGFARGYQRLLQVELERSGMQLMVVPLGCPYDAAARVVKGHALDNTLPAAALDAVRRDPAVAVAAPMLITAVPAGTGERMELWVGLDEAGRALKPWWRVRAGRDWFHEADGAILGSEAAAVELREPGDAIYCPAADRRFRVEGVLERSGTSDDSLFFVPLATAQARFGQADQLTAIAVRLSDPARLREATKRLQEIPGIQVVTVTEMMGVFLNLVGSVRVLLQGIGALALAVSALGVFNAVLAGVLERTDELVVMRALGASRRRVAALIAMESLALSGAGAGLGLVLAAVAGRGLEPVIGPRLPLGAAGLVWSVDGAIAGQAALVCAVLGILAGIYPAWRAGRLSPALVLKPD